MRRIALLLLVALLLPMPAWAVTMSLGTTYVSGSQAISSLVLTYAGTTSGRGIVCGFEFGGATSAITGVDVSGQAATLLGSNAYNSTMGYNTRLAYLGALSSGGSKTITVTWTNSGTESLYGICQELYSNAGGIAIDGTATGSTGSTANPSLSVTTGAANSALFGFIADSSAEPFAGTGFTEIIYQVQINLEESEYNLDAGASGSKTVGWTLSASQWTASAAAFTAAAGAADQTFGFRRRRVQP